MTQPTGPAADVVSVLRPGQHRAAAAAIAAGHADYPTGSASAQVARIAPAVVTWLSTRRRDLSVPSSRKSRLPLPRRSGSIVRRNSSTRSC